MKSLWVLAVPALLLNNAVHVHAQYSATYVPGPHLPKISEEGQAGTNACGEGSDPHSNCQNLYVNSATDFCLWGAPGPEMEGVGAAERKVVSYCTKSGRGTRLIPPGTLKSVHFVKTPDYVQVSGAADFSRMFINAEGGGGELDPHGQDGLGNPIGGLVFTNAFGHKLVQAHEWHSFMDPTTYCLRVCKDSSSAYDYCKNIYDELGCQFNMPTGPDDGNDFESCEGDSAQIVGVYTENGVVSTFFQSQTKKGQPVPPPKPAPSSSQCTPFASSDLEGTVKAPFAHVGTATPAKPTSSATSTSSSSSSSSSSPSSSSSNSSSSNDSAGVPLAPVSSSSDSTTTSESSTSSSMSSTPSPTTMPSSSSRSIVTVTGSSSVSSIEGLQFGKNGAMLQPIMSYGSVATVLLTFVLLGAGAGYTLW